MFQFSLALDVMIRAQRRVIWVLLHYGRLYSHSNAPQVQAVLRNLTLCEAHRLELKYGEQLLPGVDDLALHITHHETQKHAQSQKTN